MHYRIEGIPAGLAGTDQTAGTIARLVRESMFRPAVRLAASEILRAVPSKNYLAEARALHSWVARNIRYQKDPAGLETVQAPEVTLQHRAGDCDDHVALFCALALAVGLPCRLRVIGRNPEKFSHIFAEVFAADSWHSVDTTEPGRPFGWRPPAFPAEKVYSIHEGKDMSLAQVPVLTRGELQGAIYGEVADVLRSNWFAGLIDRADLVSYLSIIDSGNFPTRERVLSEPARRAIADFLAYVDREKIGSTKPAQSLTGLEGLDGFLSSVWKGVKKAVSTVGGAVLSVVPGGAVVKGAISAIGKVIGGEKPAAPLVTISPKVTVPEGAVTAAVGPGAAQAFGAGLFSGSNLPLILGAALLAVVLLKK